MSLNRFLSAIPEGTCIQTTALGSDPKFYLAWKGHHLDRDDNIVNTSGWADNDPRWESMGMQVSSFLDAPFKLFGLHPIDPFQKVAEWEMTWSEWTHVDPNDPKKTLPKRRIDVRKEKTRQFMVKNFSYAFRAEEVETALGIKTDLDFTVYVEGTNPRIALARTDDWFLKFEGQVRERAKDFVGAKNLLDLMSQDPGAKDMRKLVHPIQAIEKKRMDDAVAKGGTMPKSNPQSFGEYMSSMLIDPDGSGKKVPLSQALGIKITGASFEEFSINPKEKELLEIMSATTVQEQKNLNIESKAAAERKASILAAEARVQAMQLETAARLDRWTKVDKAIAESPAATQLAIVEAQAEAAVRVAELNAAGLTNAATAVASKDSKITVFAPGGGAQMVVPVGGKAA